MLRGLYKYRVPIIEGLFIFLVVTVIFIFMLEHPNKNFIIVCFIFALSIVLVFSIRRITRFRKAVHSMVAEISSLPEDLSEKPYGHINDETEIFYKELSRVKKLLDKKGRMRHELLDIVNTIASNMEFENLLKELMPKLNEATRSCCSAFYAVNANTEKLELKHSVGFSKNIYSEFDLPLGEGIVGQAATRKDVTLYKNIPEDTVYIVRTFLGKIKPRNLIVVPVAYQDQPAGVLVCASIYDYTREDQDMIDLIRYYLGVAVNNGVNFEKTKRLTNELSFQNKLIQDQHEDMKKRLDEKTQLLNSIVDSIEEGCLYVLDMKGVIQVWNNGAERIHGIKGSQAIGRNIERVYDENNWPSVTKAIQRTIKEGEYTEGFWFNTPSGYRFRYEMNMSCMYDEKKEPIAIINRIKGT